MASIKDILSEEQLAKLKEAERRSAEERAAAARRRRRAGTKYGLLLENDNE